MHGLKKNTFHRLLKISLKLFIHFRNAMADVI